MKRISQKLEMLVANEGCVLEVYYKGEEEPVYYERIWSFLIGEGDRVNEIPISKLQ